MEEITIYLGNKKTSTDSLQAWLMLLQVNTDFKAAFIDLNKKEHQERIAKISPNMGIPALVHGTNIVSDSLPIGNYLNTNFPDVALWPKDAKMHADANDIIEIINSDFNALKEGLPFDFNSHPDIKNNIPENVKADIQKLTDLCLKYRNLNANNGKFLFGNFSIADAIFAPIAIRLVAYDVKLNSNFENYIFSIMSLPEMQMWCNDL